MANPIINTFNAGELSPFLYGRTDLGKYTSGCRTLENFLVTPYGPAKRRPGTEYIADTKTHSDKARLIPFQFSVEQAYILELGDQYIRFYRDGTQIETGPSTPYEISTPWALADLFLIQFVQSADVMYLVHPDYHPQKLSRTSDTSWTLVDIPFTGGPFLDDNTTSTTITPSAVS